MIWVNCKKWDQNWEEIEKLDGGGQGQGYKACRKGTGEIGFLKKIKIKNDIERRARFSREAKAYYDLAVSTVPKLIESNAHDYKDDSVVPYIVTEYIEGKTLREWREGQADVALSTAIAMTHSLLETIAICHAQAHIHRDIKPDNIIIRGDNITDLVLIDFGLDINTLTTNSFATEHGQEIGNRFLRLPELAPDSLLKQDSRSDISFVGGIFFYLLTGKHPNLLLDAEGLLPHQRPGAREMLKDIAKSKHLRLSTFFDKAFALQISNRFSTAESAISELSKIMKDNVATDKDLEDILIIAQSESETYKRKLVAKLEEALKNVEGVIYSFEDEINKVVYSQQVNQNIGYESAIKRRIWQRKVSGERILETTFTAIISGDELIVIIDNDPVYRTSIESPTYGEHFFQSVKTWLQRQINIALNHPEKLPPNPRVFHELRPVRSIDEAIELSRLKKHYILAFVYDPSQNEKGQIEHQLGYFLQNKKTRGVLDATFVLALLTIEQVAEKSDILRDKSMESSRWVVFDSDFNALDEAVIYANPSEAEKISQRLSEQFQPQ